MAGSYDITALQGETYQVTVTWNDDAEDPIDLTDYEVEFQIRTSSGKSLLTLTEGDGITITDPTSGVMALVISAPSMASIKPGVHRYELELTNGDFVTKLLRGDFRVLSEVAV